MKKYQWMGLLLALSILMGGLLLGSAIAAESDAALRVPATDAKASLNLHTEQLELPEEYSIAGYSVNGGKAWKKGKPTIEKLLNTKMTLVLSDAIAGKKNAPTEDATLITFPETNKRPAANPKGLRVNYLLLGDATGKTNGYWTLAAKANPTTADARGIEYTGVVNKKADAAGWQAFPSEGVAVKSNSAGKTVYYFRQAPSEDGGQYTPAGKPVKVTVLPLQKMPTVKANYTKETIPIKNNYLVFGGTKSQLLSANATATEIGEGTKAVEAGKLLLSTHNKAVGDISEYLEVVPLGSEKILSIWIAPTAAKPASEIREYALARRASEPSGSWEGQNGKWAYSTGFLFSADNGVTWTKMPKITATVTLQAKIKHQAKALGSRDTGLASCEPVLATIEYGEWKAAAGKTAAKNGILRVRFEEIE